jgi:Protein of unknown function (DUF1441)
MTKLSLDQRQNLDTESRAIIYQGASVSQLADLFHKKTPDVMRLLGDLKPVGVGRQNNPIYDVAEAAARLIKIPVSPEMIDAYMRRVNHAHLPPLVGKAYWDGKLSRERYLEHVNDLWNTEDVIRVASEVFQSIRMSLMLIPDVLRDESGLTEGQFRTVQKIVDDALEGSRARLVTDLRKPDELRPGPSAEDGPL